MKDAAELGARRVSVGGAFARAAWGGFLRAAKELSEKGASTNWLMRRRTPSFRTFSVRAALALERTELAADKLDRNFSDSILDRRSNCARSRA